MADRTLRPDWGNRAQEVTEIRVPAGTTLYEGIAGPQPFWPGASSGLPGGGHQVFLLHVPDGWLVETRRFHVPSRAL